MAKSLLGQEFYQQKVAGQEDTAEVTEKLSEVSKRTKERHSEDLRKKNEEKIRETSDGRTLQFSNHVKIALLDSIQTAGMGGDFGRPLNLTKHGNALDIFLTDQPLVNRRNAKILLKLLTIVPPRHWSMEILQDSLCKYAALESDTSQSSRQISWKWAYHMLELLRKFRNERTLSSPTMMYIIGTTMVEKGSSKYCLGNKAIANQLRHGY